MQEKIPSVGKKMANQVSRRYDYLPLLPSGPGGVRQELAALICRCKSKKNIFSVKHLDHFVKKSSTAMSLPLYLSDKG